MSVAANVSGEIASRLQSVLQRIASSANAANNSAATLPRLVAVSKTKPIADIVAAYAAGQRYFGENYVQELFDKSHSREIQSHCPDIRWHFIGHCQSSNAKRLAQVSNLDTVETIDSAKLASLLNKEWTKTVAFESGRKLRVFIQVNTSDEEQKHGCQPDEAVQLARHVTEHCPAFSLAGLMTIGSLEASHQPASAERNADFDRLVQCRTEVAEALRTPGSGDPVRLELSMGMSADFELAIKQGSTNVRVGSTIFGERNYSK